MGWDGIVSKLQSLLEQRGINTGIKCIALSRTLGDYQSDYVPLGFHSPNDHRGERCRCSDIPRHHDWQGLVLPVAASFAEYQEIVLYSYTFKAR